MMSPVTMNQIRKKFSDTLQTLEGKLQRQPALLGDGNGNVNVSGRTNYVYYRLSANGALGEVYNNRVLPIDDLPVIVGFDPINPQLFQVIGQREAYAGIGGNIPPAVPPHHEIHEFETTGGGNDVVWVQQQQIVPLMVSPSDPEDLTVIIKGGVYGHGNGFSYFDTTVATLTSYVPSSGALGLGFVGLFVTLSVNADSNTLVYTQGDEFSLVDAISNPWQYIAMPGGNRAVPIAGIFMTSSTTTLGWDNIFDIRSLNTTVFESEPATEYTAILESEHDFLISELFLNATPYMLTQYVALLEAEHDFDITAHVVNG